MSSITRPKTIDDLKGISDTPVVIANHQGFITYINACFELILGWTEEDILGQLITTILPTSFRDSHNLAFSRFQASEKSQVLHHPIQLKTIKKNSEEIITEHYIIAEKIDDSWVFGAMLRPLV